jgi:hypothetical protein
MRAQFACSAAAQASSAPSAVGTDDAAASGLVARVDRPLRLVRGRRSSRRPRGSRLRPRGVFVRARVVPVVVHGRHPLPLHLEPASRRASTPRPATSRFPQATRRVLFGRPATESPGARTGDGAARGVPVGFLGVPRAVLRGSIRNGVGADRAAARGQRRPGETKNCGGRTLRDTRTALAAAWQRPIDASGTDRGPRRRRHGPQTRRTSGARPERVCVARRNRGPRAGPGAEENRLPDATPCRLVNRATATG